MSANAWLEFIAALVIAAFVWALIESPTNTLHNKANNSSTTTAGQTGLDWMGIWIDWLALFVLLLAVFGLVVTIVVRRGGVFN